MKQPHEIVAEAADESSAMAVLLGYFDNLTDIIDREGGQLLLYAAAKRGFTSIVSKLQVFQSGSGNWQLDVNWCNRRRGGNTALHAAAMGAHAGAIQALLKFHGIAHSVNNQHQTAYDYLSQDDEKSRRIPEEQRRRCIELLSMSKSTTPSLSASVSTEELVARVENVRDDVPVWMYKPEAGAFKPLPPNVSDAVERFFVAKPQQLVVTVDGILVMFDEMRISGATLSGDLIRIGPRRVAGASEGTKSTDSVASEEHEGSPAMAADLTKHSTASSIVSFGGETQKAQSQAQLARMFPHHTPDGIGRALDLAGGDFDGTVAQLLLDRPVPLNDVVDAIRSDETKPVVEYLDNLGGSPNTVVPEQQGYSLLYLACRGGRSRVASLLIEDRNADVNMPSGPTRSTPLHGACFGGHSEVVELLVVHGANTEAKNARGHTPEDDANSFAYKSKQVEVARACVEILQQAAELKAKVALPGHGSAGKSAVASTKSVSHHMPAPPHSAAAPTTAPSKQPPATVHTAMPAPEPPTTPSAPAVLNMPAVAASAPPSANPLPAATTAPHPHKAVPDTASAFGVSTGGTPSITDQRKAYFTNAIEQSPNDVTTRLQYAMFLRDELDEEAIALDEMKTAHCTDTTHPGVRLELAKMFASDGDRLATMYMLRGLVRCTPDHEEGRAYYDELIGEDLLKAIRTDDATALAALEEFLEELGGNPLATLASQKDYSLFYIAARAGRVDTVKRWLQVPGMDVNHRCGRTLSTALHAACFEGHHEIVEMLLKAGGNPNIVNTSGQTPQDDALQRGKVMCYDAIDDHRASLAKHTTDAATLVSIMSPPKNSDITPKDVLDFLHGHDADINALVRLDGIPTASLLYLAAAYNRIASVAALIEMGADPNVQYDETAQQTPLFPACYNGNPAIVEALLAAKCDPAVVDAHGQRCYERFAPQVSPANRARILDLLGQPHSLAQPPARGTMSAVASAASGQARHVDVVAHPHPTVHGLSSEAMTHSAGSAAPSASPVARIAKLVQAIYTSDLDPAAHRNACATYFQENLCNRLLARRSAVAEYILHIAPVPYPEDIKMIAETYIHCFARQWQYNFHMPKEESAEQLLSDAVLLSSARVRMYPDYWRKRLAPFGDDADVRKKVNALIQQQRQCPDSGRRSMSFPLF